MKPWNPPTPTNNDSLTLEKSRSWPTWLLLGLLLTLLAVGAIPGYLTLSWQWMRPPKVVVLKEIRAVRDQGLKLAGWETREHQVVTVGGKKWSYQKLEGPGDKPVILFLLAQNSDLDQPRVEWVDMNGFQQQVFGRWKTDSYRTQVWRVADRQSPGKQVTVRARFFRGWSSAQTYALLQWYAWPTGGDGTPLKWFMADRQAQTQGSRAPWIAVSIMIPIEPLGDIATAEDMATALVETIQTTLMSSTFTLPN